MASMDKQTQYYPMGPWPPNMVWGDGGYYEGGLQGRSGVFVQSIRFQWMLSLARGIVGNTLFIYVRSMHLI